MTQEERKLLLADLCGRIPYNVKVSIDGGRPIVLTIGDLDAEAYNNSLDDSVRIKPYLRPISSMTEEEQKEFVGFHCVNLCPIIIDEMLTLKDEIKMFDWLNEHHFDYRGLIPMGLALPATEGMYKTK